MSEEKKQQDEEQAGTHMIFIHWEYSDMYGVQRTDEEEISDKLLLESYKDLKNEIERRGLEK
jgi:hypothetical protein